MRQQPRLSTLLDENIAGTGFEITFPRPPECPGDDTWMTWSLHDVRGVVQTMARRIGMPSGHGTPVTALLLPEGIHIPIAALAAVRMGRIPLLINPRLDEASISHLLTASGATEVIAIPERLSATAKRAVANFGPSSIDGRLPSPSNLNTQVPAPRAPDAPAALFHTSGTTGTPKMVMWSDRQAVSGAWRYAIDELPGTLRSFILAMPSSHTAGLAFFAMCVLAGIRAIMLPLPDPENLVSASKGFRPEGIGAFSATLTELVAEEKQDELADSLKLWINMGDTAHSKHVRLLVESPSRSPEFSFGDGLGSSEMGWGSFRHRIQQGDRPASRCIGKPAPGTRAQILSPDGTPLPNDTPGLLAVSSEHIAPAYWNNDVGYWKDRRGDYFITGDIAMRASDGNYFHLDRRTDVIDENSGVYSLLLEEDIINTHDGVLDASVFRDNETKSVIAALRFENSVGAESKKRIIESLYLTGPSAIGKYVEWKDARVTIGATGKVRKYFSKATPLTGKDNRECTSQDIW